MEPYTNCNQVIEIKEKLTRKACSDFCTSVTSCLLFSFSRMWLGPFLMRFTLDPSAGFMQTKNLKNMNITFTKQVNFLDDKMFEIFSIDNQIHRLIWIKKKLNNESPNNWGINCNPSPISKETKKCRSKYFVECSEHVHCARKKKFRNW